ncbi:MAG: ABC transporter substrate-binding protein [Planctomycetota bacterium]
MKTKFCFFLNIFCFWIGTLTAQTPAELKIGISAAFSGASKELGIHYLNGARAYFNWINEQGGIYGQSLKLFIYDDQYDPLLCIKNTEKLILKDSVDILFNYVGTPTTTAILPLLKIYEQEHIVLFGNFTGAGAQRVYPYKPYVFNIRASYKEETAVLVDFFLQKSYLRMGIFYQSDSYGRSGYDGIKQELQKSGKKITAEATYLRGSHYPESMEIQVNHFLQEKVDSIISIGSYEACAAFIRDAKKLGLNAPIANVSFVGAEQLLALLKLDHVSFEQLYFTQIVPNLDSGFSLLNEYKQLMEKEKFSTNFISLEGFINAKILTQILIQAEENKPFGRHNIKKILETMKPIEIGLGEPYQFTSEIHQLFHTVYLFRPDAQGQLTFIQ